MISLPIPCLDSEYRLVASRAPPVLECRTFNAGYPATVVLRSGYPPSAAAEAGVPDIAAVTSLGNRRGSLYSR